MTNKKVELAVVTIRRDVFAEVLPLVSTTYLYKLTDTEGQLGILLKEIWTIFTGEHPRSDFKDAEEQILTLIKTYILTQEKQKPLLSKGEEVAYTIREQVYAHMDGNLKVSTLAKQYQISERGLQNSFKSLFGFTPKLFMRQLKLNLVRHELSHTLDEKTTVMEVAGKWGFLHMGRFSKFYTELFEENPSVTLKRSLAHAKAFTGECVERQEEIL